MPVCIVPLNLGCLFLLQRLREDPRRTGFACKDRQSAQMLPKPKTTVFYTIRTNMPLFHVCSCSACQKVSSNNFIHLIYLFIYRRFFILVQIAHFFSFYTAVPLLCPLYSSRVCKAGCLHRAKTNWSCRDRRSVKHDLRHELTLMTGNIFNVFSRVLKVWFYVWTNPASIVNVGLVKATPCFICGFGNNLI